MVATYNFGSVYIILKNESFNIKRTVIILRANSILSSVHGNKLQA